MDFNGLPHMLRGRHVLKYPTESGRMLLDMWHARQMFKMAELRCAQPWAGNPLLSSHVSISQLGLPG